jgi:hypothetical protein
VRELHLRARIRRVLGRVLDGADEQLWLLCLLRLLRSLRTAAPGEREER